jgi:hypothetical protein
MAKKSPLQQVRDEFGSKADLAKKVLGYLDAPEGEDAADFKHRVETMSNAKLLRLERSYQRIQSDYGSKAELVEKITKARFAGGNADYQAKISGFTMPKLLDLATRFKVK